MELWILTSTLLQIEFLSHLLVSVCLFASLCLSGRACFSPSFRPFVCTGHVLASDSCFLLLMRFSRFSRKRERNQEEGVIKSNTRQASVGGKKAYRAALFQAC